MSTTPPPAPCVLYTPGHQVHYIQVIRPPFGPALRCEITEVRDSGEIVIETADATLVLWNHDVVRTREVLSRETYEHVDYYPQRGMIKFVRGDGSAPVLCVAAEGVARTPCVTEVTGTSPLDVLLQTGGFLGRVDLSDVSEEEV